MGKASREKWEKRLLAAKTAVAQLSQTEQAGVVSWIGKLGITSALFGGFGLMQTFFWPSVVAVYLGLSLVCLDAFVTKHKWKPTRWIAVGILLVFVYFFTDRVVMREDPIRVGYNKQMNGRIDFYLTNPTPTDYRELDIHVQFPHGMFIKESAQLTNFATCSVLDLPDGAAASHGEEAHESLLSTPDGNTVLHMTGNFRRVRCEVLPHRSMLRIGLMPADDDHPDITPTVDHVHVVGSYKGAFREFDIDMPAPIQDTHPTRYGWSHN